MNLISSPLTLASHNLSSSLQDVAGYSYCQAFYGSFPQADDCVHAIGLLEKGTNDVSYAVHGGVGPHALPLSKSYGESRYQASRQEEEAKYSSGTCMIQIDVAGPRLPQTFSIDPDTIRHMADEVLNECVTGPSATGGFATSDLQVMKNWIVAEETKLDRPFRMSHPTLHPSFWFASRKDLDPQLTSIFLQQHLPLSSR